MFEKAIDYAHQFADVDHTHPYSLWGCVNGLTRYSQESERFADDRAFIDGLTGRLLSIVAQPAALAV
jgi:hypothetical protein